MKTKAITAIMVTMLLVFSAFYVLPVRAQNPIIKIGVIGPIGWPQFTGMQEGAELAKTWVNGPGGGIVIDGTRYDVDVVYGDEHAADLRPDLAAQEAERLLGSGVGQEDADFLFGGFRTEVVWAIREVAMDYKKIYTITGAATNELIDGGPDDTTPNVRTDYARYKYLFRNTPINVTMLIYSILGFLKGYVLPYRLTPLYGSPVNTAVIAEDLDWTVGLYKAFVDYGWLGPQANIVYSARTPYPTTNFVPYLDAMHAAGVRLIVHIYSTGDTISLVSQMAAHPIKALLAGIDVIGETTEFWALTAGAAQYDAFLHSTGTRTPMSTVSQPYTTEEVWDQYFAAYGHAPLYTSWGVYDSIIALHDLLEANSIAPPFTQSDYDALVPLLEATDREGVLGRFKYTQYHDPFSNEYGSTWTQHYVRAVWTQWQAGRHEVVWPTDQAYSQLWAIPDETGTMYPYPSDVLQEGTIDVFDALTVRAAFGSTPVPPADIPDPNWQFVADVIQDNVIDIFDALAVRADFGKSVALPLTYCNEAGHLS